MAEVTQLKRYDAPRINWGKWFLIGAGVLVSAFILVVPTVYIFVQAFSKGLMPALGYFAGSLFAGSIEKYAGYATLLILGIIGFNMIREGLATPPQEALDCSLDKRTLSLRTLLGQAVATSIDAFAVGVSFSLQGANIFAASPVIAVTTFVCSLVALLLGQQFGRLLGSRAEVFGGVILLLIAAKAVL